MSLEIQMQHNIFSENMEMKFEKLQKITFIIAQVSLKIEDYQLQHPPNQGFEYKTRGLVHCTQTFTSFLLILNIYQQQCTANSQRKSTMHLLATSRNLKNLHAKLFKERERKEERSALTHLRSI